MSKKQIAVLVLLVFCMLAIWDVFSHGFRVFYTVLNAMEPKIPYRYGVYEPDRSTVRSQEQVVVDAAGFTRLNITNPYGQIRIRGDGGGEVKGDLNIEVIAASEEAGRAYVQQLTFGWKKKGNTLVLEVRNNKSPVKDIAQVRIDYVLTVPAAMELNLVGNDLVKIEEITGKVTVNTLTGNTEVSELQNDLRVVQHYGYAQITHIRGDVHVNADGGGVIMEDVQGRMMIEADHGEVDVTRSQGDIEIRAVASPTAINDLKGICTVTSQNGIVALGKINGGIVVRNIRGDVQVDQPMQDADITVENGEVRVTSLTDHSVQARVFNGTIQSSRPELKQEQDVHNQLLSGTIGKGTHQLTIEIKQRGHLIIE